MDTDEGKVTPEMLEELAELANESTEVDNGNSESNS